MKYEAVIGLEVHVQLNTNSKTFCGCSILFGGEPNTQTCPICQAHPGVLPVLNQQVVRSAVLAGLAFNCKINSYSTMDRKNYFYPDLPKAYQISQYDHPICGKGKIEVLKENGEKKSIGLTRIHMEEDAGKLVHSEIAAIKESYVDLNRAGTPLLEIVSEPEISDGEEAYLYLTKLRQTIKYLGISDVNMEEGSLRCDVNISLRPLGQKELGTKAEIKNLNSFRSVQKAIEVEIERQTDILESGGKIIQETRLFNPDNNTTRTMRTKEEANDYRYFRDPDLVPIVLSDQMIEEIKFSMPELPESIANRFENVYKIKKDDVKTLVTEKETAEFFEQAVKSNEKNAQKIASFIVSDVFGALKERGISIQDQKMQPEELGKIFQLIDNGTISIKIAKDILPEMMDHGTQAEKIIEEKGLKQISDTGAIEALIDQVLANNSALVEQFKAGKTKVVGSIVGMVMKESKGKANPQMVNQLVASKMEKLK